MAIRIIRGLVTTAFLSLGAFQACSGAEETFCDRTVEFLGSVKDQTPQSITLKTFWGLDFGAACQHDPNIEAAGAYCAWLVDNSSWEFMRHNVERTILCIRDLPESTKISLIDDPTWRSPVRSTAPRIEKLGLEVTLDYSLASDNYMALEISKRD